MAEPLASSSKYAAVAEEFLHRHADVLGDLAKQRRGNIPAFVPWDCGAAAMGIAELLVSAALTDDLKAQFVQDVRDF